MPFSGANHGLNIESDQETPHS